MVGRDPVQLNHGGSSEASRSSARARRFGPEHDFWAVTSFFNPIVWRSRLQNFRRFRAALEIPLLAVELAAPGEELLRPEDADRVLRVGGDRRLWQKERLLNLGIAALPAHVRFVAWLDCDIVFLRDGWSTQARAILEADGGLMQPFRVAHHASERTAAGDPGARCLSMGKQSFAWAWQQGVLVGEDPLSGLLTPTDDGRVPTVAEIERTRPAPGFAWAARRNDLERFPLYERNVLGGGDSILAYASIGRPDLYQMKRLSRPHAEHFLGWAAQAQRFWQGKVRPLDGDLMHLPHGRLADRDYLGRNQILIRHAYDPMVDVVAHPGEALRLAPHREALARELAAYFARRREDASTR